MKPANLGNGLRSRARSDGAMHPSRRPCLAIALLLCSVLCTQQSGGGSNPSFLSSSAQAQETGQPAIPMLDEGKGLIHLDVSATNDNGEPVSGLDREDFELFDEGHPQRILSFHAVRGESSQFPVRLHRSFCSLIRFEMSNVEASRVQLSVEQFLRQNGGHLAQPISIFGLSGDGFWTVPLPIRPMEMPLPRVCLIRADKF